VKTPVILSIVFLLAVASGAWGDALVVTRAMKAGTIAEIFVTDCAVRTELEIGSGDLAVFGDLLPDEVHAKLGLSPEPWAKRLARFFATGFVIRADDGVVLAPRLASIEVRKRITRDEITGQALPVQPENAEIVVYAVFEHTLPVRPASLVISGPTGSGGTGFVLYHEGLPVNDFRYLSGVETVDLDWEDPWFSRFRNRNLWRRYRSPIQAFLYMDHFEVRKEIIIRPRDLQAFVDLGLEGVDVIPAAGQEELKKRIAVYLAGKNPVTIDGKPARATLDRIHFVRRTLRQTGIVDPPEDLPAHSATLGVIFTYPVSALPQNVSMRWELFPKRGESVPAVATDEAGGFPSLVSREDPVLTWQNFLTNPSRPEFAEVAPPRAGGVPVPIGTVLVLPVAFVLLLKRKRKAGVVLALVAAALIPVTMVRVGPSSVAREEAATVMAGLLRNVYRSFDYRSEDAIYDALSRSTSGELLTEVYLDTRRSLTLANQGGALVKVIDVEIEKAETGPDEDGDGFTCRCLWRVTGSVGHWGHIHRRQSRYDAEFTVRPVDNTWRITSLRLLNEERL